MSDLVDQIAIVASETEDQTKALQTWALSNVDCLAALPALQYAQFTTRLGEFDISQSWLNSTLKPVVKQKRKELQEQKQQNVIEYIGTKETKDSNIPPLEEMLTEFGVARRFANKFGNDFRLVPDVGWYVWTGTHWMQDTGEIKISKAVKATIQTLWDEAENHVKAAGKLLSQMKMAAAKNKPTEELDAQYKEHLRKAEETKKFAATSQNSRFIRGVASSAKTENLTIEYDVFNNDAWLLNCRNGTVDLRTGKLRPHERSDYLTWVIDIDFDPTADATLWEKTILQIMGSDEEMAAFLRRLFGYAITATCHEKALGIFWGATGDNGKTFMLEMLASVLGESLAGPVSPSVLLQSDGRSSAGAASPHLMSLRNKRIVWASESKEGQRLEVAQIKQLTGGDTIRARQLHEAEVNIRPTHTLFLITNHRPHAPADDNAVWNRLKLVEFNQSFKHNPDLNKPNEHKADVALREKLIAEYKGILTWLVLGALEWQQSGLQPPAKVKAATEEYRRHEDTLGRFIEDVCAIGKTLSIGKKLLYTEYKNWCEEGELTPMTNMKFYEKVEEKGFPEMDKRNFKFFQGISLATKEQSE